MKGATAIYVSVGLVVLVLVGAVVYLFSTRTTTATTATKTSTDVDGTVSSAIGDTITEVLDAIGTAVGLPPA